MGVVVVGFALCALLTGCDTPDPRPDSELPWNMPQSWETAPSIPGINQ